MSVWVLVLLLAIAPPGRVPSRETEDAARARYEAIATDISAELAEQPPLFGGRWGRERSAALVVAIAFHESGLRLDVDIGETKGGGVDTCLLQIRPRSREEAALLASDRRTCIRTGYAMIRKSLLACAKNPLDERLGAYTSGSCSHGLLESRAMMQSARRLFAGHPPAQEAK